MSSAGGVQWRSYITGETWKGEKPFSAIAFALGKAELNRQPSNKVRVGVDTNWSASSLYMKAFKFEL